MEISVETTGKLARRMAVAVPADRFEKELSDRLKRLSKKAKVAGFRPGKVPLKIIEAQYGGQVMQEVAGDLIQVSFQEAVGREGLRPAGGPSIEPKSLARGKDLEYVATFEVYPEVEKLDITGARIERPVCEARDEDVTRTLERMRKQQVQWTAVERPAAEGDRLIIDFKGTLDGKAFDGGEANDFILVVGSGTLIEDLERQLVGLTVGGQHTLTVAFPDDYHNQDLAGTTVEFEVVVKEIAESELPKINAEFAKSYGVEDGSLDTLRAEVKENLEREMSDRIRMRIRDQVMQALLEVNQFEIPERLLNDEITGLMQAGREALERRGASPESAPQERSAYVDKARQRVALGLILVEIAKVEDIAPAPSRVRAVVERMAASYEDPEAFVKWYYAEPSRLGEVQARILEEMVVERLLEKADVVDVPVAFEKLMYPEQVADRESRK